MTSKEAIEVLKEELHHTEFHLNDKNKAPEFYEEMGKYCEAVKMAIKALEARPQGEWIEFAEFVAKEVCTDNFKDNSDCFAELACRKLVKLGLLKLDGDTYKNCGADMKGGAE